MEQNNIVEQPVNEKIQTEVFNNLSDNTPTNSEIKLNEMVDEINAINVLENNVEDSNNALEASNLNSNNEIGSTGKFKSTEELLKAYKNLEAEFTRKSQKLKELERKVNVNEEGNKIEKTEQESTVEATPIYLTENWEKCVSMFLEENPNAKSFASEICNMVINDKQVAKSTSPLETAWQIIASKNFVDKKSIILDEDFLNTYVLNNKDVLDKAVSKYIKQNLSSVSPIVIGGEFASEFSVAKKFKPLSFEDAKKEAEKLF